MKSRAHIGERSILCLLTVCGVAGRVATSAGGPSWRIAIPSTAPSRGRGGPERRGGAGAAWRGALEREETKDATSGISVASTSPRNPSGVFGMPCSFAKKREKNGNSPCVRGKRDHNRAEGVKPKPSRPSPHCGGQAFVIRNAERLAPCPLSEVPSPMIPNSFRTLAPTP